MNNSVKNKPLVMIISYIFLTFLLSLIGSVTYFHYNWIPVFLFMFAICIAVIMGYLSTDVFQIIWRKPSPKTKENTPIPFKKLVHYSIIIALTLEILLMISYMSKMEVHSISEMLSRLVNIGDVYQSSLQASKNDTDKDVLLQIITLLGIVKQFAFVGFVWYRKELKKDKKWFIALVCIYLINVFVFKGTQKELGDIIIYFGSVWLILEGFKNKIELLKFIIPIGIVACLVFGYIQLSRAETYNMDIGYETEFFRYNTEHFVYTFFGPSIGMAITILTFYLTNGYYGLSKSLSMTFHWTYGLGSSFALSSYASQYFGIENMVQYSYPMRAEAETGYPAKQYWSTVFPWLASDYTYLGCIVLVFIIARVYATAWKEAVEKKNFLSAMLFARLNIFWLFVPANNQLMQGRETMIATVLLVAAWLLFHKRCNQEVPDIDTSAKNTFYKRNTGRRTKWHRANAATFI